MTKIMDELEQIRQTLTLQEARVILLMRENPYQKVIVHIEAGKIVRKEQVKSIKD